MASVGNANLITTDSHNTQATGILKARVVDGIVPTTSGQIGVNLVESDLGDPYTYIGQIYGTDTLYII